MKFERELSKPLYAVTVNKGLWVSLSHPIYDFLNRKNFSCFVINEHHAYQHRIVTNCINNILRSNMMRIWIWCYISYLPSARFQIRTSFQNGIVFNGSCYNMLSPTTGAGRTLHRNIMIDAKSLIEMLESSYDGIWITDGNGRILFANSANASLLGVTKEDLMGKSTEELLEKKIFSDSVCLEAIEQKRQTSKVCYNYNTQLTVLATATPIFGENGEVRYIFNNVRDITSLNNMQASLRDKEEIIRRQNKQLEDMKIRLGVGTIIANSESFRKVVELAQRVATFDGATVLILGESGTGKELVSELLVNNSPRKDMPYLQVNCGAIPENLIESELFGYEKGAFTGADNRGHKGLFEAANGGTVFLDEIGDLPLHMQVKLLRVLQQRKVTRVGGTEPIDINVRVIAATNKNLEQMVREGQFREDLYYRLNVVSVQIPPLRERKEDIVPLLNHFLTVVNQKYHTQKTIFSDTIDAFENYPWPGNVRELENVLENLVITTPGDEIRRETLPKKFWSENGEPAAVGMREILPLKVTVERVELAAIQHAIDQCGSVRKAAAALGVDPSTIVRKMQGHKEK